VFQGYADFRIPEQIPDEILNSYAFKKYIELGLIEKIDNAKKNQIMQEEKYRGSMSRIKSRAESIDSILVDSSEPGSASKVASGEIENDRLEDIAPSIDVNSVSSFKREDEQESYSNMKKLGIELD